jgi:hypothetical protein
LHKILKKKFFEVEDYDFETAKKIFQGRPENFLKIFYWQAGR